MELAQEAKSNTDSEHPILEIPLMERDDPIRTKALSDRELPR
jgi:hypothetical protein